MTLSIHDAAEEPANHRGHAADRDRPGHHLLDTLVRQRDWIASEHNHAYYEFENAFPLADFWLGIACVLALVTLRTGRPSALLWLICSGSAGLYLFGMDFLYDVENSIFGKGGGGAFEAVIVALTLIFSVTLLRWSWAHRGELLSRQA